MLKSKKHVFWEALLITLVVFALGLLLGIAFENTRLNEINDYYSMSEVALLDIFVLNGLIDSEQVNCEYIINSNLEFADRIYGEAKLLEKYEDSGKITNSFRALHRKYDLLRTSLWVNSVKTSEKCKDFNYIIYLYDYQSEDLGVKALNSVWSKILGDLKKEMGGDVLLIPIAVDSDLASLNSLIKENKIEKFPVVIVNDIVLEDINSVEEIKKLL
jgi:hypothetical protein